MLLRTKREKNLIDNISKKKNVGVRRSQGVFPRRVLDLSSLEIFHQNSNHIR